MNPAYFARKAAAVIVEAGGNPDTASQLATWAQTVRETRPGAVCCLGCLVAEDGRVVAETWRSDAYGGQPAATRVLKTLDDDIGAVQPGLVVDMARGECRRLLGCGVIHVPAWRVCQGHR